MWTLPGLAGVVAGVSWATLGIEAVRQAEDRRDVRSAEHLRHSE